MTPTESTVSHIHRVLLVDDDDAVRAMMNATLERKGFEVVPAANVTSRGAERHGRDPSGSDEIIVKLFEAA